MLMWGICLAASGSEQTVSYGAACENMKEYGHTAIMHHLIDVFVYLMFSIEMRG